ncbi:hypothetical protein BDV19DRAFT_167032 [Aspergillus venezuelensis]
MMHSWKNRNTTESSSPQGQSQIHSESESARPKIPALNTQPIDSPSESSTLSPSSCSSQGTTSSNLERLSDLTHERMDSFGHRYGPPLLSATEPGDRLARPPPPNPLPHRRTFPLPTSLPPSTSIPSLSSEASDVTVRAVPHPQPTLPPQSSTGHLKTATKQKPGSPHIPKQSKHLKNLPQCQVLSRSQTYIEPQGPNGLGFNGNRDANGYTSSNSSVNGSANGQYSPMSMAYQKSGSSLSSGPTLDEGFENENPELLPMEAKRELFERGGC